MAAAIGAFGLVWLLLAAMLRFPARLPRSIPDERSLHLRPMPCCGGLGMAGGVLLVIPWLDLGGLGPLLLLALLLTIFSAVDDFRPMAVISRLLVHLGVALLFLLYYGPTLPWYGLLTLLLLLAWSTNLYNFMDGLDGLAAGMTVIGFGAYGVAAWWGGAHDLAAVGLVLAAAALAFLFFNYPPARIFMGDGGSIPLGFLAGSLGLLGIWRGLWPPLFPLLVFSPFIVDAGVTLVRRILQRGKFWRPHRTHYYQRLARLGTGPRPTVLWAYLLMASAAVCGLVLVAYPPADWGLAALWAGIYLLLLLLIDRRWAGFETVSRGSVDK